MVLVTVQSALTPAQTQAAFLHNDKYAWFADNAAETNHPFCQAFQNLNGFELKGVNIYRLEESAPADLIEEMSYLEACGVNAIRTFGIDTDIEVDNLVAIIQAYPQFQYVVALSNPANPQLGEGRTRRMFTLKGAWFSDDPDGYEEWARSTIIKLNAVKSNLAIIEFANEPHCGGDSGCVNDFNQWVIRTAGLAGSLGVPVSFGGGLLDDKAAESTSNLNTLNSTLTNSLTSIHVYPEDDPKTNQISGLLSTIGASNLYVGELGFACTGRTCKESTNDAERAQKFTAAANAFKAQGITKVFLWLYSGFGVAGGDSFDPPLFITPEANITDIRKYLANSQVYCAPNQAFQSDAQGQSPPLSLCIEHRNVQEQANSLGGYPLASRISLNDQTCNAAEYPLIDASENWDTTQMSFPLWREDSGGISIEADLSRVDPYSTFAAAAKKNSRPEYAPQFYLTSPEMQCKNAVNHLQYVEKICNQYNETDAAETCPLNAEVEFSDGSISSLLALRSELPNESVCATASEEVSNPKSKIGQAIRAISTQTPKEFKLAFFVQHTYMHEPLGGNNKGPVLRNWLGLEAVSTWFKRNLEPEENLFPGEVVDVIPVWYNAGLALSAYDDYLQANGEIRPYNYDPETLPRSTDPASLDPNSNNFVSGWNQTYAAILPLHIQQKIGAEIRNTVADTWAIMNALIGRLGTQDRVSVDGFTIDEPIVECVGKQCICYSDSTASEMIQQGIEPRYAPYVAQNCAAASMPDVASAFPATFTIPDTQDGRNFMYALKEAVIQRVNSGVQQSTPFDATKEAPADYRGPLGERSFNRCPVEQSEYGVQESAPMINSSASQPLPPAEADATNKLGSTGAGVGHLIREFVAKIIPGAPEQEQFKEKKTSRAYLILPDEALTIEKTQSYVAPLLLSPQMYASIMSGTNPIYPFAQEGAANGDNAGNSAGTGENLSAFLRTDGLQYDLQSQPEGYGIYEVTMKSYTPVPNGSCYPDPTTGEPVCGCTLVLAGQTSGYLQRPVLGSIGPNDIGSSPVWIEKEDYSGTQAATCRDPYETIVVERESSTVDLQKKPQENPNPETPGQLAALNEFVRRMAFLPLHLVQKYTGLENFYGTGGAGNPADASGVQRQCAYSETRQVDISQYGGNLENIRAPVCAAASDVGVSGALLRSVLEIKGSPILRAIRLGQSTYTCKPANSYGAVGPLGIVVAQCSTNSSTDCSAAELDACFAGQSCVCMGWDMNRTNPDLCTLEGALPHSAQLLRAKVDIYRQRNPGANLNNPRELAMAGEGYLGWGSCKLPNVPDDGVIAWTDPATGQRYDYCAYLERVLTTSFTISGYCR